MKFIGIPVKVREVSNPFFTPKGTLPVLRDGRKTLTAFEEIVIHFKSLVSFWLLYQRDLSSCFIY